MKNTPSVLVSGLGMGMQFLQKLIEAIVRNGGHPEMLYSFCTPHSTAEEVMDKISKLIVQSDWRVPYSLLERLTAKAARDDLYNEEDVHTDERWGWSSHIDLFSLFGISVTNLGGKKEVSDERLLVPTEIVQQLVGKKIARSVSFTWKGESYVFVDFADVASKEGNVFQESDFGDHCTFVIAPANRFDFDH